jgi:hypothetical protein
MDLPLGFMEDGKIVDSRPDSGSEENLIDVAQARLLGLIVNTGPENQREFLVANGKVVHSVGRVFTTCWFPKDLPEEATAIDIDFFVLPHLAIPIVVGMSFLDSMRCLVENKHRLQPRNYLVIPDFGCLALMARGEDSTALLLHVQPLQALTLDPTLISCLYHTYPRDVSKFESSTQTKA